MKKLVFFTISFFICALSFAIEARVISVTGKAQVQKSGVWRNLAKGDVLQKGDLIQTGFKSQVVFSLKSENEDSKITINQLSRITIEQMVEDKSGDSTSIYVTTGSVRSHIKKTKDYRTNYTVRSPVATASVRGTELTLKNGFSSSTVKTHNGNVAVRKTRKSERQVFAQSPSSKENNKEVSYYVTPGQYSVLGKDTMERPVDVLIKNNVSFNSSCYTQSQKEVVFSAKENSMLINEGNGIKPIGSVIVQISTPE